MRGAQRGTYGQKKSTRPNSNKGLNAVRRTRLPFEVKKHKRQNEAFILEKLSNGETSVEALTRCRYSLNRSGKFCAESYVERNAILFERHPELRTAYSLPDSILMIFSNSNADVIPGIQSLKERYKKVEEFDNEIFNVIAETIKSRES